MNAIVCLLLIGATGEARREMTVEQEPIGVVARCLIGAVKDGLSSSGLLRSDQIDLEQAAKRIEEARIRLVIDGQPRAGWRAWAAAGYRVGAYIADCRDSGSVGYSYRLRIRNYDVRRATQIEDGHVLLTTDAMWVETVPVTKRISRRVSIHVTLTILASERSDGITRIVGRASGTADTSDFRCRFVRNRRAEPEAEVQLQKELANALATIERTGTDLYNGADEISGILDQIGAGMRTVGRLRR